MTNPFNLTSPYSPDGDQPEAIRRLIEGIQAGYKFQTLLGVTGSGKTFTMANIIATLQRPALVITPNKTLTGQLYGEMKAFFPESPVEYFVSYYDYYQPEAYVPASDTYIEKDSSINEHIEQMRLSTTKSILEHKNALIVASVSSIYGLGDPQAYLSMVIHLARGDRIEPRVLLRRLIDLQYTRNDIELERGTFRSRGESIDIFPADSEANAIRVEMFDDEIERLSYFDPLTGKIDRVVPRLTIYPKTHYASSRDTVLKAIELIKIELKEQLEYLETNNKLLEAQRLKMRTQQDIEMMQELGYCSGVENYSRYLSGRQAGEPPPTLIDYLPDNALVFIDESHVTVPQIGGMFNGDRARKQTLVTYGFRLPSALDNRPLQFDEFIKITPQIVFISATPGAYELEHSSQIVEQVVRPTGLIDPEVEIRPASSQVEDLLSEIRKITARQERVLVTTLTKRMSEDLTTYLEEQGIKVRYLHSDIDTVERLEIIRDLRLGVFDVLVGINLLREGLDLPEVSLVAILDADKEGFLRSERSLIQTIGRAARHIRGKAILYADRMTGSMERAIRESDRRRERQLKHNLEHGITPQSIVKGVADVMDGAYSTSSASKQSRRSKRSNASLEPPLNAAQIKQEIKRLEELMLSYAENLEFEHAAELRDQIYELQSELKDYP